MQLDRYRSFNAKAESFFNLLKRERIRRRTYRTREEARHDVFDYIEMFYDPKRKHVRNGMLSPVEFERQQEMYPEGVHETRGHSNCRLVSATRPRQFTPAPLRTPYIEPRQTTGCFSDGGRSTG